MLSYAGADPDNTTDPTESIPTSVIPLNQSDLHVGFLCMFIVSRTNNSRV